MRSASPPDQASALATRPIGRLLWHTCTQTTLSVGIYGVYALTNAWFVARGVGITALAAVNVVAPVLLILGAVATTVGAGGASLVSRSLGAGDLAAASRAAGNTFVMFWASAVALTVCGLLALEPLLTAFGAQGTTRELARTYATVILAGSLTATGFSSVVRAEGRMRFSTLLWLVPVAVHIVLDPLLILGLHLGVLGAALGVLGGQTVSAAMSVWFFFIQKNRPYKIGLGDLRPCWPTLRALVAVGAPSFLAGLGVTVLAVLVNTRLEPAGGAVALAAFAICARVQTFVSMPHLGIAQGLQPIVGYNAGAGLPARVRRTLTLALRATLVYGVAVAAVAALFARPLVTFFADDPDVTEAATDALRIISVSFGVAGVAPLVAAYFQSVGRPAEAYVVSIGALVCLKVPLVLLVGQTGEAGVWISLTAGELASMVVAILLLRRARA
jgi:putative MATE family efflux protein